MPGTVLFLMESDAEVDQFVREYVLGAIERAEELDICEGISFDRDEQMNPDGDSLALSVMSDFEAFVNHEREHWEQHRDAGLIEDWQTNTHDREQVERQFGERGAELAKRLWPVGAKMAKVAYEEFHDGEFPDAVDTYPDDETTVPVGWRVVPHKVTVGCLGYSPGEEIEMCLATIDEDLRLIAEREGERAVDTEIDDLIDSLEKKREDVKGGRPQS